MGVYDGALIASRQPTGQITFQFLAGEPIGADRVQLHQVGALAVGIFDWVGRRTHGRSRLPAGRSSTPPRSARAAVPPRPSAPASTRDGGSWASSSSC